MTAPVTARRIRVLVVDDSAFVRRAVARMLSAAPDIEVAGLAVDGQDALDQARALRPDVITLDVQMPRLDGLRALELLMRECPTPVLLMSSQTHAGADVTLRGLELGALDFVDKGRAQGNMGLLTLADELCAKVRVLAGATTRATPAAVPVAREAPTSGAAARVDAVAVAASTGGPAALQALIPRLPAALPAAVLVVQHIPPGFTRSLAERLDARSALPVREAVEAEEVRPGQVLIAPAGRHMRVERRLGTPRVCFLDEPRDALHRPSADMLMVSVAEAYGARTLGVVLTGMGSDGVAGLRAIRAAGGATLAQSEESCVIYGMPKAAVDAGVVDRQVHLEALADALLAAL